MSGPRSWLEQPGGAEQGFTIIEMMVVLTIMALALTMAPAIISGLAGGRLRAAADELAAQLREARGQALRRNAPVEMTFDLAKRGYTLSGDPAFHKLPDVVDAVEVAPAALVQRRGTARVRFLADGTLADGTAVPARISLRHGAATKSIGIDWLTGRISHDG